MPIFLKQEFETEIVGHGDGFISINQKQGLDEVVIWLSFQQFETLCQHQKMLVDEAIKPD